MGLGEVVTRERNVSVKNMFQYGRNDERIIRRWDFDSLFGVIEGAQKMYATIIRSSCYQS